MDIVDPILLSYEDSEGVHGLYLLKHKRIKKTYTFLRFASSYEQLEAVVNKIIPISKLFSDNMEKIDINLKQSTYVSTKINLNEAIDYQYLPQEDFYLDKRYPNNVDLNLVKLKISYLKRNFEFKSSSFISIPFEAGVIDEYTSIDESENQIKKYYINKKFEKNFDSKNKKERVFTEKNESKTKKIQNQFSNI